jgi:hypothetical protein
MIDVVEYLRKLLENIDTIYFTLDKVTPNGRRFYSFFIITNNEIKRISGYIAHAREPQNIQKQWPLSVIVEQMN